MRPDYDGVKCYGDHDWSIGYYYEKAKKKIEVFDFSKAYTNINEVIELYNIYQIFSARSIKPELLQPYQPTVAKLQPIIARFFAGIGDSNFLEMHDAVYFGYYDDFWTLVEKYKVYDRISESTFSRLLNSSEITLYKILAHKSVVQQYDTVLAEHMRVSEQTTELICSKYLEKKDSKAITPCFFPVSLKPSEYESIFDCYIDSVHPNVNYLQLLASSQSSKECPISDELRLKARKKAEEIWKEHMANGGVFQYGVGVCFKEAAEIVTTEMVESNTMQYTYDVKWIFENTDFPTLLNNFIYLFEFTDRCFRCTFPVIPSQLSSLLSVLGVKGKKEYVTDIGFALTEMKSAAEMNGYRAILLEKGIRIEDVYQWFFTEYIKNEFGTEGFVFHAPTESQSVLEKCRSLPAEMDGILKQYQLYVKHGEINRELLEMSSNHIVFSAIPSMTEKKYAYANSKEIEKEQFLLFSDQCMLGYLPETGKSYGSFYKALSCRHIKVSDYHNWEQSDLNWLAQRGTIRINESGIIQVNFPRLFMLQDLYKHGVLCPSYYEDTTLIDSLVQSGNLRYESTLLSIPEQQYFNFMLNKSEYSNGKDLRNKYIHSTCSLDENQQKADYITLLKIMAVLIIKINEEFCLKYPEDRNIQSTLKKY